MLSFSPNKKTKHLRLALKTKEALETGYINHKESNVYKLNHKEGQINIMINKFSFFKKHMNGSEDNVPS